MSGTHHVHVQIILAYSLSRFYAIMINLLHYTCPAPIISLCTHVKMPWTAEMRIKMLFNDILKAYNAKTNVRHTSCANSNQSSI